MGTFTSSNLHFWTFFGLLELTRLHLKVVEYSPLSREIPETLF